MSLAPGTRLEHYEILGPLGVGGMGEVYRAHDTRLRREVAIKFLKEQFNERFEREARAVAALNHANLCHLYAVGPNYLVMELVEGETLRGPFPFDDALPLIRQLIDGIEAAHEKNIVHRDLKPANIKITPEGVVKILDFGLAKPVPQEPEASSQNSPTLTMGSTQAGAILGTAAYMAPEQARGKTADKRSDIWSFGVVVYELLTGKPAFGGDSVVETLGAVINLEPDWALVPPRARRLLKWCLEKDRKQRLQAIGDARRVLEEVPESSPALPPPPGALRWLGWGVASVLAIVAAAAILLYLRAPRPSENVLNLSVTVPQNVQVAFLSLSPDGRRLAIRLDRDGKLQLYVRALDSQEYRPLPGTDQARLPFWSPDSRFIGFFADGKLKTIPAAGGPATTLCGETGTGGGGAWNREGVILFSSQDESLRRVNAFGGACTEVKFDGDFHLYRFPEFLPDGNHFLGEGYRSSDPSSGGVYLTSFDGMQPRRILKDNSSVLYASPGSAKGLAHVLFLRGDGMMAQPFDPKKLEGIGDPVAVVEQASASFQPPQMAASVVNDTLVYLANRTQRKQLTWFDRSGTELGRVTQPENRNGVNLSPNGDAVASQGRVLDLNRNQRIPIGGRAQVWSPDGTRIVYMAVRDQKVNLFLANASGGGEPVPLLQPSDADEPMTSDWSRDGRYLIYTVTDPKGESDIWFLPDPGKPDSKPVEFLATGAMVSEGQLSPDGHWLAYYSLEGENGGVYARPFPSGSGVSIVALSGARDPRWSRDGKELFFVQTSGLRASLMVVAAQPETGGSLRFGTPRKLFDYQVSGLPSPIYNEFNYSPHPDGKRFLMSVSVDPAPWAINVITGWEKLLAPKTP
jgi:eukaryotic-like serine/threonine-protein kinase